MDIIHPDIELAATLINFSGVTTGECDWASWQALVDAYQAQLARQVVVSQQTLLASTYSWLRWLTQLADKELSAADNRAQIEECLAVIRFCQAYQ